MHKRLRIIYDIGEYEIYYYTDSDGEKRRHYRICSLEDEPPVVVFTVAQSYLFTVTTALSVIALTAHIVIYTSLKKLRTQPAQNLLALAVSLALSQFLFLTGINYSQSHSICVFIATALHLFSLVSAFWMNVMSFDICRSLFSRTLLALPPTSSKVSHSDSLGFNIHMCI